MAISLKIKQNIAIRKAARRKDGQAKYQAVTGTSIRQYATQDKQTTTTKKYRVIVKK